MKTQTQFLTLITILLAEFLGSLMFAYLGGCIFTLTGTLSSESMDCSRVMTIALTDGFLFYALVYLTMKLSSQMGGYFNPAITLGLMVLDLFLKSTGRLRKTAKYMTLLEAFTFILAQVLGAFLGVLLVPLTIPNAMDGNEKLMESVPYLQETILQTAFLDFLLAFVLMVVVLAVRNNEERKSSLVLAFTYMVLRLLTVPVSGSSVNPARAVGHTMVSQTKESMDGLWAYTIPSIFGCVVGTLVYVATVPRLH
eukprot:gb/GEZN01009130.1/.p1 GENE.gb/GEZN01009130.1/~~gb/GEZN01009130.1/.p1  ORF type:complete len:253 (+),score=40.26 gb/GEZN01009130.1/:138-896(+)